MRRHRTLTAERLRHLLEYDWESGVLRWRNDYHHKQRGSVAGFLAGEGRRLQVWIDGRAYYAHRLVWLYVHGVWPDGQLDHVNGQKLDNRIQNLREATTSQNKQNTHKAYKNNQTGLLGVSQDSRSGRWRARIMVDGRSRSLGSFSSSAEASAAYVAAKAELHPFWAA